MNLESFRSSPSGRLSRVGQGDAAYWAFVPHPLPPELLLDAELVRTLSRADRALGELAGLGRAMPNPHLLVSPLVRREAVLSSRIEGTQADIADLYAYEARQLPLPGLKLNSTESDVREVFNYVRAMEYGLERLKTLPVSLRFVRELHQRLMEGVRGGHGTPGEFRRSQNWIGRPGCTLNEATFVPPPVPEMLEALDALEKYLYEDDTHPPLIRLALIHYQFEAIHPFVDGNGRIGRLSLSLLLVNWNLLPLPLLHLSAFFEWNRLDYYDLLLAVSARGAWREWLLFFLQGVAEQSGAANQAAKNLQDLQTLWRRQLQEARVPSLFLAITDLLFEMPFLSGRVVQERFSVTHPTAMQALQRLEGLSILEECTGRGRNRLYRAKALLEILE